MLVCLERYVFVVSKYRKFLEMRGFKHADEIGYLRFHVLPMNNNPGEWDLRNCI